MNIMSEAECLLALPLCEEQMSSLLQVLTRFSYFCCIVDQLHNPTEQSVNSIGTSLRKNITLCFSPRLHLEKQK